MRIFFQLILLLVFTAVPAIANNDRDLSEICPFTKEKMEEFGSEIEKIGIDKFEENMIRRHTKEGALEKLIIWVRATNSCKEQGYSVVNNDYYRLVVAAGTTRFMP